MPSNNEKEESKLTNPIAASRIDSEELEAPTEGFKPLKHSYSNLPIGRFSI